VNLGLRQDLWNKRVAVVFTVADLFQTMRRELNLDTPELAQHAVATRDSRVFMFSFTYRFGTGQDEKEDDSFRFDNGI
jgi:hypothetical protein